MMTTPYCDGCGVSISADQNFCIKCGRTLVPVDIPLVPQVEPICAEPQRPPGISASHPRGLPEQSMRQSARPAAVSALTAFVILGGIIDICMVLLFLVLSTFSFHILGVIVSLPPFGWIMLTLLSSALIVSSAFSFVLAYGIWKGLRWAWTWMFISCIINLITSVAGIIVGIGVIGLVIYPIIIYYLTRPRIKSYFGK
jgi:uncharacterized membrane protein (DUF2068 family)